MYLREDSPLIDYLFFMAKLEDGGPQTPFYQQLSQEENRIDWRFENGKVTVSRPITSYTSESFGLVQLVVGNRISTSCFPPTVRRTGILLLWMRRAR